MSATVPARLGKYEVRGTLGNGAMGTVYDGWDPAIDRRVAIKTARLPTGNDPEAQESLARFKREAQAAGRLSHPNIVGVFDYGETDEVAFIVMEFVAGRSLHQVLAGGERMTMPAILRLMDDILAGLQYSHERGVVHRDIKPANIMFAQDERAKIADFGIARIESSSMTQAGTVLGTPPYMSPEQFTGQVVDRRTDIYSAGVLLYQLLTGDRPFDGGLTAIMHKVLNATPPPPSALSVTCPPSLDAVVARAMAKRPEDRFDDAAGFARAIHAALTTSPAPREYDSDATIVEPRRPTPVRETPPPVSAANPAKKSSRLRIMLGGGAGLLIAAGVAAFFLMPAGTDPAPPVVLTNTAGGRLATQQSDPVEPPPPDPKHDAPGTTHDLPPTSVKKLEEIVTAPPAEATERFASIAPSAAGTRTGAIKPPPGGVAAAPFAPESAVAQPPVTQPSTVQPASVAKPPMPDLKLDPPVQQALDVLRPQPGAGKLAFGLLDRRQAVLSDRELMLFGLTTPGFAGHLRLDYLEHDGTVTHMVPSAAYPDRTYPAGVRVELGRPRPDFDGWKVGPPFGTDMVVAIVSTAPVLGGDRPDGEPIGTYLRDLQAAADDLRRRGGTLAVDTTLLELRP